VAKHASLLRAGRAALVTIGLRTMRGHITSGRPLSFGARPWCEVRAVSSNAQSAFAWHTRKRYYGGCLSGGGETRKLAACAPCRAGCDRPTYFRRTPHRREESLFRHKTVMRRANCDLQRVAGIRVAHTHVPLRWLSLGRWRNTRACRMRAVPRWLRSAHVLWEGISPAEGLSLSAQDRGARCEL